MSPSSASKIKLLCILASEVGLQRVQTLFPDVEVGAVPRNIDGAYSHVGKIWVAATDPELTRDGLISPGLGDTVSSSNNGHVSCLTVLLGRPAQ